MSKTLTLNTTNGVATTKAVRPIILVSLEFGLSFQRFATQDVTVNSLFYKGKVTSFSGIRYDTKSVNTAAVSSVNFSLNDNDGSIRTLINNYNIEGKRCYIYEYFGGLTGLTATEIYSGRIAGPVTIDSDKINFTIVTDIKSNQIGFSIKEDQFSINNQQAIGKVWPKVFGKVAHVPSVLVQRQPIANLKYPIGFGYALSTGQLYSLVTKNIGGDTYASFETVEYLTIYSYRADGSAIADRIYVEDSSAFVQEVPVDIIIDGVIFSGSFSGDTFTVTSVNNPRYSNLALGARETDVDTNNPLVAWLADSNKNIVNHYISFDEIPFAKPNIIRRVIRQEGRKIWLDQPIEKFAGTSSIFGENYIFLNGSNTILEARALNGIGLEQNLQETIEGLKQVAIGIGKKNENSYGAILERLELQKFMRSAFWQAGENSTLREFGANPDIYVCNDVSSNEVTSVYGIRTYEGKDRFAPIPSDYYTINLNNSTSIPSGQGPQNVTTISFIEPLSSLKDQGWKDEVYATVDSNLSNNPADVMDYCLSYTNLTKNSSSFSNVATATGNYPTNFVLERATDALKLLEEVAYMSRCGVIYDSSTIKLKYLSAEPTSVKTIGRDDIVYQSIEAGSINHNLIKTAIRAIWRETHEPQIESNVDKYLTRLYTYENNIPLYGYDEQVIETEVFNSEYLVAKTMNFWGYRQSQIWRTLSFKCFHNHFNLEIYDAITLNFGSTALTNFTSSKGIVIALNNSGRYVDVTVMLPMLQGDNTQDSNFWINDNESSAPDNPANKFAEVDYDVQIKKATISTDQSIERLKELRRKQRTQIKIKSLDSGYVDQVKADVYGVGIDKPPTETDVKITLTSKDVRPLANQVTYASIDGNGEYYLDTPTEFYAHITDRTTETLGGVEVSKYSWTSLHYENTRTFINDTPEVIGTDNAYEINNYPYVNSKDIVKLYYQGLDINDNPIYIFQACYQPINAKITGNVGSGANQWNYNWTAIDGDGNNLVPAANDTIYSLAENGAEKSNTSTIVSGKDMSSLPETEEFEAIAVPNDTIVQITFNRKSDGTYLPRFSLMVEPEYICVGAV